MATTRFDGVDDVVVLDPGGFTSALRPVTGVAVIRTSTNDDGWRSIFARINGSAQFGFGVSPDDELWMWCDGETTFKSATNFVQTADDWIFVAVSKDSSGNIRYHKWTEGAGWTHTNDGTGTQGAGTSPSTGGNAYLGGHGSGGTNPYDGDIGAVAVYDRVLTDAEIEALYDDYALWLAGGPIGAWLLTDNPIVDDTGAGADEDSRTGTSAGDDIPAWFTADTPLFAVSESGNGTNDLTFSHTVVDDGNYLYVVITNDYFSNDPVSGVTYNGDAMTQIGRADNTTGEVEVCIYRLANPDTGGAHDVVVSVPSSSGWIRAYAVSIVADDTTPNGTVATATNFTATPSVSPGSDEGDLVIGGCMIWDSSPAGVGLTSGAGQVAIWDQVGYDPSFGEDSFAGSIEYGATTSTTHSYTASDSNGQTAIAAVALKFGTPGGGGTDHDLPLSDTITLSDAAVKAAVLGKADTITLGDAVTRAWAALRSFADTTTLSDAVGKNSSKPLTDTVTLSDAVAKSIALSKADTITMTDVLTKVVGLSLEDSFALSEQIGRAVGKTAEDTITLADGFSASSENPLTPEFGDIITLTDDIALFLNGQLQGQGRRLRHIVMTRFGLTPPITRS
jgi:hypothetical protein